MTIRTLIIDDELLAIKRIRNLLRSDPDIEISCECPNGREAVSEILARKPDLIFLDVQMPELNGFEVLETISPEMMPAVVFVTAYDQYALKAFEVHAIDYLLKPFSDDRFQTALDRVKEELRHKKIGETNSRIQGLLEQMKTDHHYLKRILVKIGDRVQILFCDEIDWIEAEGYHVRLHGKNGSHLLRETMGNLEKRLDPQKFIRIHRSTIINMKAIKEMQRWFQGEYLIILKEGSKLPMSKGYQKKAFQLLDK